MNRTATTEDLKALIAAHAAEIAALKVENEKLAQRVVHLEEQLRLERLHRYAPRSEKLTERIFNEAEQAAAEGEETNDVEAAPIADTGLPCWRSSWGSPWARWSTLGLVGEAATKCAAR